jgi:hypothetical protein
VFSNEKLAITLVLEEGSVFNIKGQNWMLVALFTGERNVSLPEALMFKAAHHQTMQCVRIDTASVLVWFQEPVVASQRRQEVMLSATAKQKLATYLDEAPLARKSSRKRNAPERLTVTPKVETVTKRIITARQPKETTENKPKSQDNKLFKMVEDSKSVTEDNACLRVQNAELKGQLVNTHAHTQLHTHFFFFRRTFY